MVDRYETGYTSEEQIEEGPDKTVLKNKLSVAVFYWLCEPINAVKMCYANI